MVKEKHREKLDIAESSAIPFVEKWLEKVRKIDRVSSKRFNGLRCSSFRRKPVHLASTLRGNNASINPASAHETWKLCAIPPPIVWKVWSRFFSLLLSPFPPFFSSNTGELCQSCQRRDANAVLRRRRLVELPIGIEKNRQLLDRAIDEPFILSSFVVANLWKLAQFPDNSFGLSLLPVLSSVTLSLFCPSLSFRSIFSRCVFLEFRQFQKSLSNCSSSRATLTS